MNAEDRGSDVVWKVQTVASFDKLWFGDGEVLFDGLSIVNSVVPLSKV